MKRITITLDEEILDQAREVAAKRGRSLDAIVEEFLKQLCGIESEGANNRMEIWLEDTFKLFDKTVKPRRIRWTRNELHRR